MVNSQITSVILPRTVFVVCLLSFVACAGKTCSETATEAPPRLGTGGSQRRAGELRADESSLDEPKKAGGPGFRPTWSRGPTGRWPEGFPAYRTVADIVTDGTTNALRSALDERACAHGCVIEHPGDISALTITRMGTGQILVRPPIGRRADYSITSKIDIRGDNVLIAGFDNDGYMLVSSGSNSGFAWIEVDGPGGGLAVHGNVDVASGFFYEIVYRQYAAPGTGDRGGVRASGNGRATMLIVGSILTGTIDPPPTYHADTLQIYYDAGSSGAISIRDSVVWPAYDKALQAGSKKELFLDNVFLVAPSEANIIWPGPGSLNLGGYYHTTGSANMVKCTVLGRNHPDFDVTVSNSKLWDPGKYSDAGGNTILRARPSPPAPPTSAQLDAIWSP